jgi:hypothetical protein
MTQPANPPQNPNLSPPPKLFAVALCDGEMWQLGQVVPGSDLTKKFDIATKQEVPGTEGSQAMIIMDMIQNEDMSVEVFALPVPGSELDNQKTGAVLMLYPLTIRRTMTLARFDVWKEMVAEANAPDDDEEEEEEEEEEVPALPSANGAPSTDAGVTS